MSSDKLRVVANISDGFLFSEVGAMPQRYKAAADAGFNAVECAFPYGHDLVSLLEGKNAVSHEVKHVLINSYPGKDGELGLACDPKRIAEFRKSFTEVTLKYASALKCSFVHVMAGKSPPGSDRNSCFDTLRENLCFAVQRLAEMEITALIEPLNSRVTNPDYFLDNFEDASNLICRVGHPNLKLQFDFFHCRQQYQSPVVDIWEKNQPYVGHVQVSQVPFRDEPWGHDGEIDLKQVYDAISHSKYSGYVGLEYKPRNGTTAGLNALRDSGLSSLFDLRG